MYDTTEDPRLRQVQAIIVDGLGVGVKQPALSARLYDDLGMDSLDTVEIVMDLEEHFGIDIGDEDLEDPKQPGGCTVRTVQDVLDYLNKRLGPAKPIDGLLRLTESQFIDRYRPEEQEYGGYYLQREWGDSKAEIQAAIRQKRCWTVVDDDDGEWLLCWGNRSANRLYNVITSRPIENEDWNIEVQDPEEDREMCTDDDQKYQCVVPCSNASGEPDLFFCEIICRETQYNEGLHYAEAKSLAGDYEYEGIGMVIDENDPGFQYIHFDWGSITAEFRRRLPLPKTVAAS